MLADRTRLHIALQKSGRLADSSRDLLRDAGLRIEGGKNSLTARVGNFAAELMFVRDDDIPTFVSDGVCEFGIVGQNVLQEFALGSPATSCEVLAELGFGHCTLKIAVPEGFQYDGPKSLAGSRIATSYPRLLRRFLEDHGVTAEVVEMNGAVELAPRLQIANFVCDLVSSIGLRVRISTASLSRTVSTAFRPLASSVAPVETRSQTKFEIWSRGASSTAPFISTTSAVTPRSSRKCLSSRG